MQARFVLVLVLAIIPVMGHAQTTWYVPDDFPRIQDALSSSSVVGGDTVVVRPGTYVESLNFLGKSITLKSEKGPSSTILDTLETKMPLVLFQNDEIEDSVLDGFSLKNGRGKCFGPNDYRGGAIYCLHTSPTVRNCVFFMNIAKYGGAIYYESSSPLVTNCIFDNNIGMDYGGAIYSCKNATPIVTNCSFCYNSVGDGGGAVYQVDSAPVFTNCTFYENSASANGSAMYNVDSSPQVINCIFWQNSHADDIMSKGSSSPIVTYCDVEGGYPGTGNVDADPLFVDQYGWDFHLTYDSPCRNAGTNTAAHLPVLDFEGDPRVWYGQADMGADEFHTHLYWTGDAQPGGSVQGKLVGHPGTIPVGLLVGSGVLMNPISTQWGDFLLQAPWSLIGPLGPIPNNGVYVLPATIPGSPPPPYDVPMQALIGNELTNLYVLEVRY